jgi:hypothetical protein
VLVEDTWQHRGLGTALVRRVAETAEELGMRELIGTVPADEVRITRLLRRAGLRPTAVLADGTLQLNVPLESPGRDGLTRRRASSHERTWPPHRAVTEHGDDRAHSGATVGGGPGSCPARAPPRPIRRSRHPPSRR